MITEDYVSFEIAKLLKEKGFDKYPLFPCYKEDYSKFYSCSNSPNGNEMVERST